MACRRPGLVPALLAVATGHQRHGYGQRLKIELLSRAQQAGMDAVYSLIDWDNDTAIALNRRLGAVIVPDPEAPHQLMIATIKLR
jgi:ribosomal protein S18 acetylase RimI-like enzyme